MIVLPLLSAASFLTGVVVVLGVALIAALALGVGFVSATKVKDVRKVRGFIAILVGVLGTTLAGVVIVVAVGAGSAISYDTPSYGVQSGSTSQVEPVPAPYAGVDDSATDFPGWTEHPRNAE